PLTLFLTHASIICVEVLRSAQSLHSFVHPSNPVYVFGPEDDSLSREVKSLFHYFVTIPTQHYLNVAHAAKTIMWDSQHKRWLAGGDDFEHTTSGEFETRGMLGSLGIEWSMMEFWVVVRFIMQPKNMSTSNGIPGTARGDSIITTNPSGSR